MSEPTSVVGVENKEECNKSADSTASGRSQEAAVNKKERRYKQQTWRHAYDVWRWAEREDENEGTERIDAMKMKMKTIDEQWAMSDERWRWRQEKKIKIKIFYVETWKSTRLGTREDR